MSSLPLRCFLIAIVLAVLAAPAWGYIVVLKDGQQLITKEKYRIEGDRAYMTLQNGVETFFAASEIDIAKTDELNETNLGQVRVLEQGTVVVDDPQEVYQPERLSDLSGIKLSMPESHTADEARKLAIPLTEAGFVNLWALKREIHQDLELTDELRRYLKSQGVEGPRIFKGSAEGHVLLELVVTSETMLFNAIRHAATALVQTQARFPEKLTVLELVMTTHQGFRAGQFMLTKELADRFLSGKIDQQTFFYRYVQF